MADDWREKLREAKFRGAVFLVQTASRSGGRQVAKHRFPQADRLVNGGRGFDEDLGRLDQEHSIEAWFVGRNYHIQMKDFLGKLEQPGPGQLVHPILGEITVQISTYTARDLDLGELNVGRVSFTCSEAVEQIQPLSAAETGAAVEAAAEGANAAAAAALEEGFGLLDAPQFVVDSAKAVVGTVAGAYAKVQAKITATVEGVENLAYDIANFEADAAALVQAPAALAARILSLTDRLAGLADPIDFLGAYRELFAFGTSLSAPAPSTPQRIQQAANQAAIARLVETSALISACSAAGRASFASREAALAVRDELAAELDERMETAGDEDYAALQKLRAALVDDIERRAAGLGRLVTVTPAITQTSLVLAYAFYGPSFLDQDREADIVARNKIFHPGFVPGGEPLEFLSDAPR